MRIWLTRAFPKCFCSTRRSAARQEEARQDKKKRGKAGEKAKELTPEQKAENQHQASQRVYVEHGVRRCKAWRILRDELRLGRGLFPLVAMATVGLVHLARLCPGQ